MEAKQAAYRQYTQSEYFREVSRRVKARDGHKCVACGETKGLQAHHNTYAHRGRELEHLGDLTTLCQRCHCAFHRKVGIWVGHGKPRRKLVIKSRPPKSERFPPVPPPADLPTEGCDVVTHQNRNSLLTTRDVWHWVRSKGIDPTQRGWKYRLVGWHVPKEFFQINRQ